MGKNSSVSVRLTTPQRMKVLALIARGDTYEQISQILKKEDGKEISAPSISHIKKTHSDTLEKMRGMIVQQETAEVAEILVRSRRMTNRKLARAERDETELDKLNNEYRQGNISTKDYENKKRTLLDLSINQLVQVSKEMHSQILKPEDSPAGSEAGEKGARSNFNPDLVQTITEAIKKGDTVKLQQVILNDKSNTITQ